MVWPSSPGPGKRAVVGLGPRDRAGAGIGPSDRGTVGMEPRGRKRAQTGSRGGDRTPCVPCGTPCKHLVECDINGNTFSIVQWLGLTAGVEGRMTSGELHIVSCLGLGWLKQQIVTMKYICVLFVG